jgi:hypothetical protein
VKGQPGGLFYAKDVGSGGIHVNDRPEMLRICVGLGFKDRKISTAAVEEARVENRGQQAVLLVVLEGKQGQ